MTKIKLKKNKGPVQYRRRKSSGSGFVILFAVTLSAILLSIALGVANIALKEIKFGTSAKDTNEAFFAADTGAERALFKDKSPSILYTPVPGSWSFVVSGLGSGGQSCSKVSIVKTASPTLTTIISKGYNAGGSVADSCNPPSNSVEREIKVSY